MAQIPFPLLIRRLSLAPKLPPSLVSFLKPFSTSNASDPSLSLSDRMRFVFDQIDAIQAERTQKDEALQRIRSWRESKSKKLTTNTRENVLNNICDSNSTDLNANDLEAKKMEGGGLVAATAEVELVHPWKEWIELMERLVQQNYFDHRRKNEDGMARELGFDMSEVADEGFDFTRDFKTVQTACLNFGRDRFDILRSLSRLDIQILIGYGCPSTDKKVVFSAKLLRKLVHLDEGDVCSSCSLRGSCERAYLLTNKEDEARTIDIMRILLTFGFDPVNGSVSNESLLKQKSVKTVVRKLLHEVVKLSAVPIDPNLPPPVIKKPPPKVKQPPPPPRRRVGRDDIEMKKGDWLCPKCDFMNFAKNTVCLQCDAKRPKRQLLPGEWECPQCNFLNYRRNMACFHCEHKRPPDEFMENQISERGHGSRTRPEKILNRQEVSNAWNFDFDDDESDGADVAAFEHADSPRMDEELDSPAEGGNLKGQEDFYEANRFTKAKERDFSHSDHEKSGMGFNDFDDEDDDIDGYVLDTQNSTPVQKASSNDFSEVEGYSESEDIEGSDNDLFGRRRMASSSKPPRQMRRKAAFSGCEDDFDVNSDEDLPVHRSWKSSHVADSRPRNRGRGSVAPSRSMSFGSDEELGLSSGTDDDLGEDFPSRQGKGNKWGSGRWDFRRGSFHAANRASGGYNSDDDDLHPHTNRLRGNKARPVREGKPFRDRDSFKSSNNQWNSFGRNFNKSSRGPCGDDSGSWGDDRRARRRNDRVGNVENFGHPRQERSGRNFNKSSQGSFGDNNGSWDDDHRARRMNDRGGNMDNFGHPRQEKFGRSFNKSSRGFYGDNTGSRGDDRCAQRMNDGGGNMKHFGHPRRERFGNQQRRRFDSDVDERFGRRDRPPRIIER